MMPLLVWLALGVGGYLLAVVIVLAFFAGANGGKR